MASKALMAEGKKRQYEQIVESESDDVLDTTPLPRSQRSRRSKKHRTTSTFTQLESDYNFIVDVEDALEDYLKEEKLKTMIPMRLDMSEGCWERVDRYYDDNMDLKHNTNVLLTNGTFLRVNEILMDTEQASVILRGYKFLRTSRLEPMLDDGQNDKELFWDLKYVQGSQKSVKEQSLVDVPLSFVERIVDMHLCNSERSEDTGMDTFFCRWKLTRCYRDSKSTRRSVELAVERLRPLEADRDFRVPDDVLKFNWRGISQSDHNEGESYTALDGFCCSGGWSRGASMAGFVNVVRSFDLDARACKSYRANFPQTNCLNVDVFDYCFPQRLPGELSRQAASPQYVDIAHYSTPCQYFSPAHTTEGKKDDENFAPSFSLGQLLDKDRPRVVTFENTFGLERRHFLTLKAIFGQITSRGYSLRFATLNLADWGLPQDRKRLIMLASCPGEILPTFPEPTHSKQQVIPGTLPWVTKMEAIEGIPFNGWQNHHPEQMKTTVPCRNSRSMARTITTGGAGENHPEGRQYTICEYQLLQGFPLHHRFAQGLSRTQMLRQIGNAFPPLFVKNLIRHIRKRLQRSDGIPEIEDGDEFMSLDELRQQQIAQFFEDHDHLPEGTRANVEYVDEDEDEYEMIMDEPTRIKEEVEEGDLTMGWNLIASPADERRLSSSSADSSSTLFSHNSFSTDFEYSSTTTYQTLDSSSDERQSSSSQESLYDRLAGISNSFYHPPPSGIGAKSPRKSFKSAWLAQVYESLGKEELRSSTSLSPFAESFPGNASASPNGSFSAGSQRNQSGSSMENAIELD